MATTADLNVTLGQVQCGGNVLTWTQALDNAAWTKNNATISADADQAPDGTNTADRLTGDGTSAVHEVRQAISGRGPFCFSVHLKQGTERYAYLYMLGRTPTEDVNIGAYVDLQTGTLLTGTSTGATITALGNGGYRVSLPRPSAWANATQTEVRIGVANAGSVQLSTASGYVSVWGAQLEPGAQPGPYVRADGAAPAAQAAVSVTASLSRTMDAVRADMRNLLSSTRDWSQSAWTKRGTCTATLDPAQLRADGTLGGGACLIAGLGTGANDVYQQVSLPLAGVRYEPSLWMKRVSTSGSLIVSNPQTQASGQFNVDLAAIGPGWVAINRNTPGVTVVNEHVNVTALNGAGMLLRAISGSLSFYVDMAQNELGPTPGSFSSNPQAASAGLATEALAANLKGNNLLVYSEQLNQAQWTKAGTVVTADQAQAPNGAATADFVRQDGTTGNHDAYQGVSLNAGPHTASAYLKAGSNTWGFVAFQNNAGTNFGTFVNLSTGALGTAFGAGAIVSVANAGGGWWRVSASGVNAAAGTGYVIAGPATGDGAGRPSYAGDNASGVYIWGAMLNTGTVAAAYEREDSVVGAMMPDTALTTSAAEALSASLTQGLDPATLSAAAAETLAASLSQMLAPATLVTAASEAIGATLATALAPVTLLCSATQADGASLAQALGPVTLSAQAAEANGAALSRTLGPVLVSANATEAQAATLALALGPITTAGSATEAVGAAVLATLQPVALLASAAPANGASLAKALGPVTLSAQAASANGAALSVSLRPVDLSCVAAVIVGASLSETLGAVSLVAAAINPPLRRIGAIIR